MARRASYSNCITLYQYGWAKACMTKVGSTCPRNALCFEWLVLALVNIGWSLRWRVGGMVDFCIECDIDSVYWTWEVIACEGFVIGFGCSDDIDNLDWVMLAGLLQVLWGSIDSWTCTLIGCDWTRGVNMMKCYQT